MGARIRALAEGSAGTPPGRPAQPRVRRFRRRGSCLRRKEDSLTSMPLRLLQRVRVERLGVQANRASKRFFGGVEVEVLVGRETLGVEASRDAKVVVESRAGFIAEAVCARLQCLEGFAPAGPLTLFQPAKRDVGAGESDGLQPNPKGAALRVEGFDELVAELANDAVVPKHVYHVGVCFGVEGKFLKRSVAWSLTNLHRELRLKRRHLNEHRARSRDAPLRPAQRFVSVTGARGSAPRELQTKKHHCARVADAGVVAHRCDGGFAHE